MVSVSGQNGNFPSRHEHLRPMKRNSIPHSHTHTQSVTQPGQQLQPFSILTVGKYAFHRAPAFRPSFLPSFCEMQARLLPTSKMQIRMETLSLSSHSTSSSALHCNRQHYIPIIPSPHTRIWKTSGTCTRCFRVKDFNWGKFLKKNFFFLENPARFL